MTFVCTPERSMPLKVQPEELTAGFAGVVVLCARTIGADNESTAPANAANHDAEVMLLPLGSMYDSLM
jgi:hypothetical protein